jgi:hypothetical protein
MTQQGEEMNIERAIAFVRRGIFASLTVAALATAGPAIVAASATADPNAAPPGTSDTSSPPAIPGVLDVGKPGEETRRQTEPTIDPRGNPFWPNENSPSNHAFTARDGWTAVIADGARIRTHPVTGTILGLIPLNDWFWVSCKTKAPDGTVWGYATHAGRYGWVRSDLWEIIRTTVPNGPPTREIPWC